MLRITSCWMALVFSLVLGSVLSAQAFAQDFNRRLFGNIASAQIAILEEVAKEVQLTDEQKKSIREISADMMEEFGEIFQNSQGDFEKMAKDFRELQSNVHKEVLKTLDEKQCSRMQEIYMQVNNGCVLLDDSVVESLKISKEQQEKLTKELLDVQQKLFASFGEWQGMSSEERNKRSDELIEARDKALIDVLTDEQKANFEKAKGAKIEVDLNKIPMPGQ